MTSYEMNRHFEKHKTSCKYALTGSYHAFVRIDFRNGLIYLHEGGINPIPVRLSDVSDVHCMDSGKLESYEGTKPVWSKENML